MPGILHAPGQSWFKRGKAAIVVTQSSNKSGPSIQGLTVSGQSGDPGHLGLQPSNIAYLEMLLGCQPTVHEAMLLDTELFCQRHNLNDKDDVSPIMSVMGATNPISESFRRIRPGAIALEPGYGHQGGGFKNSRALLIREGPLAGHWGIKSSSRAHCFPWMEKYGGSGDPKQLEGEMARAVDGFRNAERTAYAAAGVDYPF